jgi:hypothetical protein
VEEAARLQRSLWAKYGCIIFLVGCLVAAIVIPIVVLHVQVR